MLCGSSFIPSLLTSRSFPLCRRGLTTCLLKEQVHVMAATVHNTSDWLSWPQRMDLPTYHTDKNSTLNACTSVGLTHAPQKLLEKKLCGCLQVCNICATFVGHEMFTYQNNTSFLAVLLPHGYLI